MVPDLKFVALYAEKKFKLNIEKPIKLSFLFIPTYVLPLGARHSCAYSYSIYKSDASLLHGHKVRQNFKYVKIKEKIFLPRVLQQSRNGTGVWKKLNMVHLFTNVLTKWKYERQLFFQLANFGDDDTYWSPKRRSLVTDHRTNFYKDTVSKARTCFLNFVVQ